MLRGIRLLDYIVVALAPSLVWLFIARMISGICGSSLTVAKAYIADISTPEDRAKNFGMIGAAFGLGFVVGPAMGGFLGEIDTRLPFYAAAGLSLLNWLYGYFVIPESLPVDERRPFEWKRANPFGTLRQLFKYKTIVGLVVALFFVYVAAHATHSNWAFFTEEKFGPVIESLRIKLRPEIELRAQATGESVKSALREFDSDPMN